VTPAAALIGDGRPQFGLKAAHRFRRWGKDSARLEHPYSMRLRKGLELAEIERLYRDSRGLFVRTAAAITGDWRTGEDAVHDAFVIAVRERRRFRGDGSAEAWLWAIVINAAKAHHRQPQPGTGLIAHESITESEDTADRRELVRRIVYRLPERQRLALFLRYYADLDYATIAGTLGISEGTVAATLHAARSALRHALTKVDS
jgi:RNA polymerase sigma factor (sigma-70 family)